MNHSTHIITCNLTEAKTKEFKNMNMLHCSMNSHFLVQRFTVLRCRIICEGDDLARYDAMLIEVNRFVDASKVPVLDMVGLIQERYV